MSALGRGIVLGLLLTQMTGCAAVVVAGVPINFVTTEVLPRAVNGKGLVEDGADLVTGKDCRLVEGVTRKDRQVCEPRGSPATKKDFKGLAGLPDRKASPDEGAGLPEQPDPGGP